MTQSAFGIQWVQSRSMETIAVPATTLEYLHAVETPYRQSTKQMPVVRRTIAATIQSVRTVCRLSLSELQPESATRSLETVLEKKEGQAVVMNTFSILALTSFSQRISFSHEQRCALWEYA